MKGVLLFAIAMIVGMMMQVGSSSVTIADEQISVPVRAWADEVIEAPGVPDLGPSAVTAVSTEGAACESGACSVSSSGSSSCESAAAGPVRAVGSAVVHRLRERPILRGLRSRVFGGRCR